MVRNIKSRVLSENGTNPRSDVPLPPLVRKGGAEGGFSFRVILSAAVFPPTPEALNGGGNGTIA